MNGRVDADNNNRLNRHRRDARFRAFLPSFLSRQFGLEIVREILLTRSVRANGFALMVANGPDYEDEHDDDSDDDTDNE